MAQAVLVFEGREVVLSQLPNTFDKLKDKIKGELRIAEFSVQVGNSKVTSTNDLLVAYLNNQEEKLVFAIEDQVKPMSYVDNSMDSLFAALTGSPPEPVAQQPQYIATGGVISLPDLKTLLNEINKTCNEQMFQVSRKFQEDRLAVYKTDDRKYQEMAVEQMQFQAYLQMGNMQAALQKHNISPEVFQKSIQAHQADIGELMGAALGEILSSDEVPEGLTKAKFREVLEFSSQFSIDYLNSHPNINRMEFGVLKLREADEVFQTFGFAETEISAAFKKYNFDDSPEWDDIKDKLGRLQEQIMHLESGL